jgi:hypothetical protein
LAQYHFKLLHKPGRTHEKPDFLSRPPNLDKGEKDNENLILLPQQHFRSLYFVLRNAEVTTESFADTIRHRLASITPEKYDRTVIEKLAEKDKNYQDHEHGIITYQNRIYIPHDNDLRNEIIRLHHDTIAAGHPGRYKTHEMITRDYWWPRLQADIRRYIDGCCIGRSTEVSFCLS